MPHVSAIAKHETIRAEAAELCSSLDDETTTKEINALLKRLKSNWSKGTKAIRAGMDAGGDDESEDDDDSEASDEEECQKTRGLRRRPKLEAYSRKLFSRAGQGGPRRRAASSRRARRPTCAISRRRSTTYGARWPTPRRRRTRPPTRTRTTKTRRTTPSRSTSARFAWTSARSTRSGAWRRAATAAATSASPEAPRASCPICKKSMSTELLLACFRCGPSTTKIRRPPRTRRAGSWPRPRPPAWGTKLSASSPPPRRSRAQEGEGRRPARSTRLLKPAPERLEAHDADAVSLSGPPDAKREALRRFKDATVLLVPLYGGASGQGGGGAAGLTLTSASTAVLLEPALQPGIEQQAAGRISRLGQTKTASASSASSSRTRSRRRSWRSARPLAEDGTSRGGAALKLGTHLQQLG